MEHKDFQRTQSNSMELCFPGASLNNFLFSSVPVKCDLCMSVYLCTMYTLQFKNKPICQKKKSFMCHPMFLQGPDIGFWQFEIEIFQKLTFTVGKSYFASGNQIFPNVSVVLYKASRWAKSICIWGKAYPRGPPTPNPLWNPIYSKSCNGPILKLYGGDINHKYHPKKPDVMHFVS